MTETKLTMRKLSGQDIFTILRLLSKLGVKDLVLKIFGDGANLTDSDKLVEKKGASLIMALVEALTEKLPDMQDDLNKFLADLTETDVATIMELDFDVYMNLIIDFIKKEELVNFIQQLSQFSSMGNTSSETSSTEDTVM